MIYKGKESSAPILIVACLAIGAAVLWAIMGSWLTAHEITRTTTECTGYYFCFFIVMVGALVYLALDSWPATGLRAFKLSVIAGALLIVISSCRYSDNTFIFWKIKAVKPQDWGRMISDLRTLDKQGKATNSRIDITREQNGLFNPTGEKIMLVPLPKSFDALGLSTDCRGGTAGTGINPSIVYGTKSRRWGLVIGSNDFSHGNWALFKHVEVGDDAWFFVGPDY